MKKFIPKPIKPFLMFLIVLGRCILRGPKAKVIRLNLAGVLPPPGEIVHGGKVKLLHLKKRFGDSWNGFNIAYFVSSGLPFAPNIWIKLYKLFGVKIVWNQNGVAYPGLYPQEVVDRVNGLMMPIHKSDYVIYQTKFVKKCAGMFLGEFKGPSEVIYNPIDTDHYTPRSETLPVETFVIITTINHSSIERLSITLECVRKIIDRGIKTKLIILGSIKKAGWIKAETDLEGLLNKFNLKESVEMRGAYLQSEAPKLFQEGHVFFHLKYLDPCPTLVLEAMACGLPVIGSASGGMPELVGDNGGILIPLPESFDKLIYPTVDEVAEAVLKIRSDLNKFSLDAREQSLKFRKEPWLEAHERIFKQYA